MTGLTKNFETSIERQLREALEARGFKHGVDFSTQYPLRFGYILDIAFPDEKVAVEADGTPWHSSDKARQRDHIKDKILSKMGWIVFRFSDRQIACDCGKCVELIGKALENRKNLEQK